MPVSRAILSDTGFDPDVADQLLHFLEDCGLRGHTGCIHLAGALVALLPDRVEGHELIDMLYTLAEQHETALTGPMH